MLHKLLASLSVLLVSLCAYCQPLSKTILYSQRLPGSQKPDTCHYVYIERDTTAECYNLLSDVTEVPKLIRQSAEYRSHYKPLKIVAGNFPAYWCPVRKLYKGEPFLYAPCDWYGHSITSLAANAVIYGPTSDPYIDTNMSISRVSSSELKIRKMQRRGSPPEKPSGFNIYIIDTVNNIAVFEDVTEDGKKEYSLMIDVKHIRSLPAIVYHCSCSKAIEYHCPDDGHYIDFPASIKERRLVIRKN